jgi:hypothetical protein
MGISSVDSAIRSIQMINTVSKESIEEQNEFIQKLTQAVVELTMTNRQQQLVQHLIDLYV